MYDAYKTKYRLLVVGEDGSQYNIKEYASNLGWEENPKELAMRVTFSVKNDTPSNGRISDIAKPGCLVIITAECGSLSDEVARGYITRWQPTETNRKNEFKVTAYDESYNLQKSEDALYYQKGMSTSSIVGDITGRWGIPLAGYDGPNIVHDKLIFTGKALSEILYDVMDDATKKSGVHALVRCEKGKMRVIRWGKNNTVWAFESSNSEQTSYEISTESMITRVNVIGEENDEGRTPVEATVEGQTRYGIRQKIYKRGTDETPEEALAAANEILDEHRDPEETMKIIAPDVPFIRKGDRIYCKVGYANGYYYVKGIRHDASNGKMTMDITKKESED